MIVVFHQWGEWALVALLEALLLQLQLQMLHHLDPVAFGVIFLFLPYQLMPSVLPQHYLVRVLVVLEMLLVALLYLLMVSIQQCWVFLLVLNPMP